jgi:ubiquinone/menaquinone biosynthesis C-methylase UbiE
MGSHSLNPPVEGLRDIYERRAEAYQYHGPGGFPSRKHRGILEHLDGLRPDRFLEVGCGDGPYLAWSTAAGYGWTVGIDLSLGILVQARQRLTHEGRLDRASLAVADGASLPFRDSTVDLVLCTQVIEHIPDDRRAMLELARILSPGGCLVVTTDHRDNQVTKALRRPVDVVRWLLGRPEWHPPFLHRCYSSTVFTELVRRTGLHVDQVRTYRYSWPSRLSSFPILVRLLDAVEERLIAHKPFSQWGDILLVVATKPSADATGASRIA